MSATVIALYNPPTDVAAFDKYYYANHVPLAKTLPGLRRYEVSNGKVGDITGATPYHLVATLTFDSMQAIQAALASPVGAATAGDLQNFATGGVSLLMFESKEI
ncbi:MAG: EthD family reductase [Betaproteobacteria bacterium]